MPNGPMRITSGPFEPELYKSEMEVQDAELKVSVEWKMGTMGTYLWQVLKRIARVGGEFCLFHISQRLPSSCLPGSSPEFCKSKNPEKEEKEGV